MSAKDEFARLVDEACRVGGHKTKKEAITTALNEYIRRRRQMEIISLFGTLDWDPTYDYKAERWRKRRRMPVVGRGR